MGDALSHAKEDRVSFDDLKTLDSLRRFETVEVKKISNGEIKQILTDAGIDEDVIKEIGCRLQKPRFNNGHGESKEVMDEVKRILNEMPYDDFVRFRDEGYFTLEGFEYPYELVRHCLSVVGPDREMEKTFTDTLIHTFKVMKKANVSSFQYNFYISLIFPGDTALNLVEDINWLGKENTERINKELEGFFTNHNERPIETLRNYCRAYIKTTLK